jgi:hypothetical protein
MAALRVFTFSPGWGLPSVGPFALKLLAWLELAKIPYEQVIEDDPRKGPKGKNPWIKFDGEIIGDTELIIELLSKRYGVDLDSGLNNEQKAIGLAWRRTFEEHFHQVLEWELFEHPLGAAYMKEMMLPKMPPLVGPLIFSMLRTKLREQLYARGIGRHTPEVVEAKGRADIDGCVSPRQAFPPGRAANHHRYRRVWLASAGGILADADSSRLVCQVTKGIGKLLRSYASAML